jgi:hypothetical protein
MPNWCSNQVSISHEDRSKVEALALAIKEGKFCSHVIPVPEDLQIVAGRVGADGEPDQVELERRTAENVQKYGAGNWYDFCVSRWGTKWEVDPYDPTEVNVDEYNTVEFGFDSAWSPPIGIYEALVEDGFQVTAWYYEPGMGYVGKWDNGCDDCVDYSGETSQTVRDVIGEELDEMWGISESMAEYEEEEKDEVQVWYEDGVEKKGLEPHVKD